VELSRILDALYAKLARLANKPTDEKYTLEKEINDLETQIDEIVFDIYGLTDEEKRIVQDLTRHAKGVEADKQSARLNTSLDSC
jgi:phage shock protein A